MNAPAGTASNWKKGKSSSSPTPPFDVSEEERKFLLAQRPSGSRLHKNVSYRPAEDEEQGRDLPLHKRNDLLHVDAFPSLFD